MKIQPFKRPLKWWRRWRGRMFLRRLRKMLGQFDERLYEADFTRHERRRLIRIMVKDIGIARELLKNWEEQ